MKNALVAKIFYEMADILDLMGENVFRIRAYRRAAQNIENLARAVEDLTPEELKKIPGVGADLAGKIQEIIQTGACREHQKLKTKSPEGLTMLLAIPGLGPRTAKLIYDKFKVTDIDSLEKLAREHKLKGLPKIREKTEQKILKGIEFMKKGTERKPLYKVRPIGLHIIEHLRNKAPVKQLEMAGSLRRWKETVKDIDILATSGEATKVMDMFAGMARVEEVLLKGMTKTSIIYEGVHVDLRVVEEESFGAALAYFTGSKAHNIKLREMAMRKGLKLNEYGVFDKDEKRVGGRLEEEVYDILGVPFIEPELREDTGEIEAALKGKLPSLIKGTDLKGDLHVHSIYSDGKNSFEQIVEKAKKLKFAYIGISDHSKSLAIAKGMSEEKLLEEIKAIDSFNKKSKGVRLLKGIEVDIKNDGTLDYPDELLSKLDVVNAAIHSGFQQGREQLTKRVLAAIKNPFVNIISHPTGRVIGEREAYDIDLEQIFRAARETGTALEINSYPNRLDLSDGNSKRAKEHGIKISIASDSHTLGHFDYLEYGLHTARRGWLEKEDVLNTLPTEELLKVLREKRKRFAPALEARPSPR
jgi:DNA polymerase (family 10)